eukprot:CAMPEP_0202834612 /NCGR_PEP_ID=MMETSP1389-20130828/32955_1 /ASSEMBLY_ACC=CAM_ASM_000865 /TAXON_ID=302021 /ORGANISM="Rhodomonas sp., Strain CCMP768" /LENGTH=63 /DNA_ID=CAMNT_0049509849 /DNA_START=218 /DNA_END=406 /DNA_ORIENTATION=+
MPSVTPFSRTLHTLQVRKRLGDTCPSRSRDVSRDRGVGEGGVGEIREEAGGGGGEEEEGCRHG